MPNSTPPRARRTRRGVRTSGALVGAARRVFERDGYLEARIVDIAAEAGVATGSFYTHFSGKEEVFEAVLAELQDEMLHPGAGGTGADGAEADASADPAALRRGVEAANRAYLESYRRNAALMAALEQAAAVDRRFLAVRLRRSQVFVERSARTVVRLQQAGLADPALDPDVTARAINAMVSRTAYMTFVAGDPVPFEELVRTLTRLWMNALGMPRAPE
ncbi:TetR/AcrR family transcriptional regulator [Streptomyces armeniacus]|uniref:TetR/AcrR family transcriptional regulator n=1 Tax=Streptomyces armeniacus TaxID=83291 RepID=A0A345XPL4_9ACTN|nr:TetR/AcrR family transcriptional regulator [Streptomyces armeniacus]AXK33580.1 TetR/AcrR family transcriptional regulator [Streptomyces armeniacus]